VNYWKGKPAGEIFTHILEQEKLYLEKGFEIDRETISDNEKIFGESQQENLDTSSILLPTVHLPFHVIVDEHDFKEDFNEWKQQLIPQFYSKYLSLIQEHSFQMSPLLSVVPSTCLYAAFPQNFKDFQADLEKIEEAICSKHTNSTPDRISIQSAPVVLFHLSNSSINQFVEQYYSAYTLHNWPLWTVRNDSDIEIVVASLLENSRSWKLSMPGEWISPVGLD
jgi:hypothetical protein